MEPQRAADVVAVTQVIAAFNHAVDFGDGNAFACLFVDDGVLDMGHLRIEGRADLAAFAASVPERVPNPRHHVVSELVTVDGDTAAAHSYAQVLATEDGATVLRSSGVYHDRLTRTPEGWRFVERRFVADPPPRRPS